MKNFNEWIWWIFFVIKKVRGLFLLFVNGCNLKWFFIKKIFMRKNHWRSFYCIWKLVNFALIKYFHKHNFLFIFAFLTIKKLSKKLLFNYPKMPASSAHISQNIRESFYHQHHSIIISAYNILPKHNSLKFSNWINPKNSFEYFTAWA